MFSFEENKENNVDNSGNDLYIQKLNIVEEINKELLIMDAVIEALRLQEWHHIQGVCFEWDRLKNLIEESLIPALRK